MESDKLRNDRVEVWTQVRAVCAAADELVREAKRLAADDVSAEVPAREAPKGPPLTYIRKRTALRQALLTGLRPLLVRQVGEQQAGWGLEPMVIAICEREHLALGGLAKRWSLPLLQLELLDVDDGGNRFYEMLTRHLDASGTHPLVFELYLLCLKQGFQGLYEGREPERQALIARLVDRVGREDPRRAMASARGVAVPSGEAARRSAGDNRKVTFISFPYRYYVGAVCLAVCVFLGLRGWSQRMVAQSSAAAICSASSQDNPPVAPSPHGR